MVLDEYSMASHSGWDSQASLHSASVTATMSRLAPPEAPLSALQKALRFHWGVLLLICAVASIGFLMLYSVAGGDLDPWASRQITAPVSPRGTKTYLSCIDYKVSTNREGLMMITIPDRLRLACLQ